jgi:urea carboxylase
VKKVLVANRGEIACRIIRTLDRMGIASVAVYSEPDSQARHVHMAGESVCLGPAPAAQSYLRTDAILDAAKRLGVDAIHPGYGFLSENSTFAAACRNSGIVFVGPRPEHLAEFGLKHIARDLARRAGVPMLPGSGLVEDAAEAVAEANRADMLSRGIWGVPTFRVNDMPVLWGQDRLWMLEEDLINVL